MVKFESDQIKVQWIKTSAVSRAIAQSERLWAHSIRHSPLR